MIESQTKESKSNGRMEKAIQSWQGQLRTLKLALEDSIAAKIPVTSVVFQWLCTWAATSLNRYHVCSDGKTAFARITGTQCVRPIAEFGEQILWKESVKHNPKKAESLWREGTFLGVRGRTGEVYVAVSGGEVIKCRTIRARPEKERWNSDRVLEVKDTVARVVYRYGREDDNDSEDDKVDNKDVIEDGEETEETRNEEQVAELIGPGSPERQDEEGEESRGDGWRSATGDAYGSGCDPGGDGEQRRQRRRWSLSGVRRVGYTRPHLLAV